VTAAELRRKRRFSLFVSASRDSSLGGDVTRSREYSKRDYILEFSASEQSEFIANVPFILLLARCVCVCVCV